MGNKSGWRNWGDYPPLVVIGGIAGLIAIFVFVTGIPNIPALFKSTPTKEVLPVDTPQSSVPELKVGSTWASPKDGMVMMFVPSGEFTMGSNDSEEMDERSAEPVNLDSFWIDKTEVTNRMYAMCVQDGACSPPNSISSSDKRPEYYGNGVFADYPVVHVSWYDAKAYCEWRGDGTRLPTEAEWEKSASWDDNNKMKFAYPWGNDASDDRANYNWIKKETTKVGNYSSGVSYYGLLDMAGNVWEWVSSLYQPYPYSKDDGREDPSANGPRVLRGGSWSSDEKAIRSVNRNIGGTPKVPDYLIGFRCARSE